MIKISVFFRLKDGVIVEVQKKVVLEKARNERETPNTLPLSDFDIYCMEINDIANSEYYKDAEIIASSFGPFNL